MGLEKQRPQLYQYFTPPLPERDIAIRRATIVGEMYSGKTTLASRICEIVLSSYGEESVNIIYTERFSAALKAIDNKPVQVIVVDDALGAHFSQGMSRAKAKETQNLAKIRHIVRAKSGRRSGLVIILFITQNFSTLDPFFRAAPVLLFKTSLNDHYSAMLIRKILGREMYKELARITYRIYFLNDEEAKSRVIVKPVGKKPFIIRYSLPKLDLRKYWVDDENGDDAVELLLREFGDEIIYIPDGILKGFLLEKEISDFSAIYRAKYRAYKHIGSAKQKDVSEMAEEVIKLLGDKLHIWLESTFEEKLGIIFTHFPDLPTPKAKKVIYIIQSKLREKGLLQGERWLTPQEAATLLGVSTQTLRRYLKQGKLYAIKLPGGHYRFALSSILNLKQQVGQKQQTKH